MRQYGIIHTGFWFDPDVRRVSEDARLLLVYLVTGPHTSALGLFRLPLKYVEGDFSWPADRVEHAFEELLDAGFISYCEHTQYVLVHRFLKWNKIPNPNVSTSRAAEAARVPKECWLRRLLAAEILGAEEYEGEEPIDVKAPLERWAKSVLAEKPAKPRARGGRVPRRAEGAESPDRASQPAAETRCPHTGDLFGVPDELAARAATDAPEAAMRNEAHAEGATAPNADAGAGAGAAPGEDAPEPKAKKAKRERGESPTSRVWEAYCKAYRQRYGVDPVVNAKVRGQLAQFIKRVPQDDAPEIAAFYVRQNNQRYVGARHAVGVLLSMAEAIYTDWSQHRTGQHLRPVRRHEPDYRLLKAMGEDLSAWGIVDGEVVDAGAGAGTNSSSGTELVAAGAGA